MNEIKFASTLRNLLRKLNTLQIANLLAIVKAFTEKKISIDDFRRELVRVVGNYSTLAAEVTGYLFNKFTGEDSTQVVSPDGQVESSVRYGIKPILENTANIELLTGITQRYLFDTSRKTIIESSRKANMRFARYASANACAFCRMLSIRGAVYGSEESAGKFHKYHDNCHCLVIPIKDDDYELPDYMNEWEKEYEEAWNTDGATSENIVNIWRKKLNSK